MELFNMVQKLKGTMRVYCRVKPIDCFKLQLQDESDISKKLAEPLNELQSCIQVSDAATAG